jgi:hypothetical protein
MLSRGRSFGFISPSFVPGSIGPHNGSDCKPPPGQWRQRSVRMLATNRQCLSVFRELPTRMTALEDYTALPTTWPSQKSRPVAQSHQLSRASDLRVTHRNSAARWLSDDAHVEAGSPWSAAVVLPKRCFFGTVVVGQPPINQSVRGSAATSLPATRIPSYTLRNDDKQAPQ